MPGDAERRQHGGRAGIDGKPQVPELQEQDGGREPEPELPQGRAVAGEPQRPAHPQADPGQDQEDRRPRGDDQGVAGDPFG